MKETIQNLLQKVKKECKSFCHLISIAPFASGVENCVFKAYTEEWKEVVIRVPWQRRYIDEQNEYVDTRISLEKERKLNQHCYDYGIPVPKIHYTHLSDSIDFIIEEFVAGNDKDIPFLEMGKLTHQLHHIEFLPTILDPNHFTYYLSNRIVERMKMVEPVLKQQFYLPEPKEIQSILESYPFQLRLLHMDIRPENLIFHNSKIKAVFDWTNALIGDPVLELMRIKDYGYLNEDFMEGYENGEAELARVPDLVKWFYQIDTSAMLTNLFITGLNDFKQGEKAKFRLLSLYERIQKAL
ncbi:phosphotransferase family protein [Bacillus sp. CGMCC 1.16607]|uniref:phosphotransferase family protein n=1 Tax=Bacillus sp. CGMCC 1.16607 TaxID=3351842 RepID=UPI0036434CF1